MDENSFSAALGRDLRKAGASLSWKINDRFAGGTPDMFIEGARRDLWLENKWLKPIPKRESTLIDLCHPEKYLSYKQQDWLKRRHHARGDTAVVLASEAGCLLFPGLDWQTPFTTGHFLCASNNRKFLVIQILNIVNS